MNFTQAAKKAVQAAKARQCEMIIYHDPTATAAPANNAYFYAEADDPEAAEFYYAAAIALVIDADGHPTA